MKITELPHLHVVFAGNCAWRGVYLELSPWHCGPGHTAAVQIARLVFDPSDRPTLSGAFPYWIYTSCAGLRYPKLAEFRFTLPHLRWKYERASNPLWLRAYQFQQRLLHRLDGRFREWPS